MNRDLDLAWQEINALGGFSACHDDHVYNQAISHALAAIERLGGRDPLVRQSEERSRNIPHARLDALQGADDDGEAA